MKLGLIEIENAYLGNLQLDSSNAFIGTTPLIDSSSGPTPPTPTGDKYIKVADFTTLTNGDEIVFVYETTSTVVTDCFDMPASAETSLPTTNQGAQLSTQSVTITNDEFSASDLNSIVSATYNASASYSREMDASALTLKLVTYNNGFALQYTKTNEYLNFSSFTSNRRIALSSQPIEWSISSNLFTIVKPEGVTGNYINLRGGGNSYGSKWIANYTSSSTWTYAVYKKVQ